MKLGFFSLIILILPLAIAEGPLAKEANDNPFLNGVLNAKYEGEVTALAGEIISIEPTPPKYPVYELNLRIEGVKNIWVTSIAPEPEGGLKIGDMVLFKGFISKSSNLDPKGDIEKITRGKTLLMAIQSQKVR